MILQTMNYIDPCLMGKIRWLIGLMIGVLDKKDHRKFVGLRAKRYNYLIDDVNKNKKVKGKKNCFIKIKLKFEIDKNSLEATQLDNKIKYLEKN